jgi:hypothetical protein
VPDVWQCHCHTILDRYGRLIDPVTKQIIKPDPHRHAYAAAGRSSAGDSAAGGRNAAHSGASACNRSPITANKRQASAACPSQWKAPHRSGRGEQRFAVTSLVLGIIASRSSAR